MSLLRQWRADYARTRARRPIQRRVPRLAPRREPVKISAEVTEAVRQQRANRRRDRVTAKLLRDRQKAAAEVVERRIAQEQQRALRRRIAAAGQRHQQGVKARSLEKPVKKLKSTDCRRDQVWDPKTKRCRPRGIKSYTRGQLQGRQSRILKGMCTKRGIDWRAMPNQTKDSLIQAILDYQSK